MDAYIYPAPPWSYTQIGTMAAIWFVLLFLWLAVMCPPFWTLCQQGYRWLWRPVKVRIPHEVFEAQESFQAPSFDQPAAKGQVGSRVMREHQGTVISLAARRDR